MGLSSLHCTHEYSTHIRKPEIMYIISAVFSSYARLPLYTGAIFLTSRTLGRLTSSLASAVAAARLADSNTPYGKVV